MIDHAAGETGGLRSASVLRRIIDPPPHDADLGVRAQPDGPQPQHRQQAR
ncbi:MAG: hypothetical protein AAF138_00870 [Planctomycetota bacterium]